MTFFQKTTFTDLAPNVQWDDVLLSLFVFCTPWRWYGGGQVRKLEDRFTSMHAMPHAYAFTSGRAALQTVLKALDLPENTEVLLQAYTCVAVPDAVRWAGYVPIYVDISEHTLCMSVSDAEQKVSPRTRAIIVQHTFGLPADMDELLVFAKKHNLILIEDVAHALGSTYQGQVVGSFGDAAIFSFGRNKTISSVFGGVAVVRDAAVAQRVADIRSTFPLPSRSWIAKQLLYAPITTLARYTHHLGGFGKIVMRLGLKTGLIVRAVQPLSARHSRKDLLARRFPDALAILALHQLDKLPRYIKHRQDIAELYRRELAVGEFIHPPVSTDRSDGFLRYTLRARTVSVATLMKKAAQNGIILGDWYQTPIAPAGIRYDDISYDPNTTPVARDISAATFNLPTDIHIRRKDAMKIVTFLRTFQSSV